MGSRTPWPFAAGGTERDVAAGAPGARGALPAQSRTELWRVARSLWVSPGPGVGNSTGWRGSQLCPGDFCSDSHFSNRAAVVSWAPCRVWATRPVTGAAGSVPSMVWWGYPTRGTHRPQGVEETVPPRGISRGCRAAGLAPLRLLPPGEHVADGVLG